MEMESREKVLRKIKACLELSQSGNSNEAAQALTIKAALAVLATASCVISGWLTVELVTSMEPGLLAMACGLTFHGMQYGLAAAARGLMGNPLTKLVTWVMTALFLALSISASVSFLESGYRQSNQVYLAGERSAKRLQILDDAITDRQTIAKDYQKINYKKDSATQLDKLQDSILKAESLDQALSQQNQPAFPAMLALIAAGLPFSEATVRLFIFVLIGGLLDLSGLLAIFYLFQPVSHGNGSIGIKTDQNDQSTVSEIAQSGFPRAASMATNMFAGKQRKTEQSA